MTISIDDNHEMIFRSSNMTHQFCNTLIEKLQLSDCQNADDNLSR